jgi:6-phosphofructokinase 1
MKRIAVLTSGGDAPGMNAAIRAVTRTAIDKGWEVFGVQHGYSGLCGDDLRLLTARSVGGVIQQGGTILGSARCAEFRTVEGRQKAINHLANRGIDGLIVIGGNGSQTGAFNLHEMGFPVVGVASTIDNDLFGSDITIGVDTALNIALEAIDRLKVTATSHKRGFLLEVMGRDCGYLALVAGIAGGAEAIVIPEKEMSPEEILEVLHETYQKGKAHGLIVVAEGAKNNAAKLAQYFKDHEEDTGFDLRVTTLGHVQRGGAPGAFDRFLATRLGAAATDQMAKGNTGVLCGLLKGEVTATPLDVVCQGKKPLDTELLDLARALNH